MKKLFGTFSILLAICIFSAIILDAMLQEKPVEPIIPTANSDKGIEFFSGESELLSYINDHFVNHYVIYDESVTTNGFMVDIPVAEAPSVAPPTAAAPIAPMAPDAVGSKNESMDSAETVEDVSSTNVQVEGIDEGDILKTDGNYIYLIRDSYMTIVDISGKEPKEVSVTSLKHDNANDYVYINEMYIKDDIAILISNENVAEEKRENDLSKSDVIDPTGTYVPYPYVYTRYTNYTVVSIYDISDRENPTETRKIAFEGNLISSRESNGKLYLVNTKYVYRYDSTPILEDILPKIEDSITGTCTPEATEIAKCIWPSPQSNIMTVAIIDYTSEEEPETLHMMGSGSNIYMNSQNLYVFSSSYNERGTTTEIAKYSIADGIKSLGTASAPGRTSTQFAYDEYNGKFRIATTASVYNGKSYVDMNNIYVYDENMELCGSLTGLAPTENIKSARFMGDTAYLVTFRQVDPLFVIDMSENDPVVVGELKIPGFSTYLHPVGEGLLLGIGSETVDNYYGDWVSTSVSGLKVSLFDVSDPTNPTEVDVASYVGGKNAYSVAKDNHNAFVYSSKNNIGYFPLTTYDNMWNSTETVAEVRIEDEKLEVRVADLSPTYNYYSESRVCYAGKNVYLYRNNTITKLDRDALEFICETKLTTP